MAIPLTIGSIIVALVLMATNTIRAELALLGALGVLVLCGVIDPAQALVGFANQGMHTVALLFIVADAMRRNGVLERFCRQLIGKNTRLVTVKFRLLIPIACISAVINNTPLVAMMVPVIRGLSRHLSVAPSRLLLPVSYAAILGGVCTSIGTSTNLVIIGLIKQAGLPTPGFFEIGRIGLVVCGAGLVYLLLASRFLPERKPEDLIAEDPRTFTSEFIVDPGGPLDGKRLDHIQATSFPRLFPVEILRGETVIPAPQGGEILLGNDRLVLAGEAHYIVAAQGIKGLHSARDRQFGPNEPLRRRRQLELVVSHSCPLVGHVVGDGSFRRRYNAAVIALSRHGEIIPRRKPQDWILEPGDTLLVEAAPGFLWQHRYNPDFYVVTERPELDQAPPAHQIMTIAVFAGMIACVGFGLLSMFQAAFAAAFLLMGLRVLSWHEARSSLDTGVLLAIAAAIGLSEALMVTGAADAIASVAIRLGGDNPWLTLALIYVATTVCTEVVTNNAAAAIMLPPALSAAARLGVSYQPFVFSIMVAASASFITPIGYQTNLMVYGPGGYRFTDFIRFGLPLSLLVAALTIGFAPVLWPFS